MINKAMILAAGFGTRLKPLTDNMPKALVPFRNGTMISYQINKLKSIGINEIVINAHHFSEQMQNYFTENNFGIKINVIVEKEILGTGGGILNAKDYFRNEEAFLVMNVDVFTNIDIALMIEEYKRSKPLALLAVQKRKTSRYLEFSEDFILAGRLKSEEMKENYYAFNGIHIISNEIFKPEYKSEYKDILDIYLELSKERYRIKGYDTGDSDFIDLGKIENLKIAESLSD